MSTTHLGTSSTNPVITTLNALCTEIWKTNSLIQSLLTFNFKRITNVSRDIMEKFLRDWRQDALNKHQYDSAIFIGDKLLAITSDYKPILFVLGVC
jgi:hypothetical protein